MVLIAGGCGITPFISMIKDNLHQKKEQSITLLYVSRTEKDIIFKDKLNSIDEKWLKKVFILSQGEKQSQKDYECGHISKEIIQKHVKNINESLFYVCGPKPMKESVIKILNTFGVKNNHIFYEECFW